MVEVKNRSFQNNPVRLDAADRRVFVLFAVTRLEIVGECE
jgi:hypothetical protein